MSKYLVIWIHKISHRQTIMEIKTSRKCSAPSAYLPIWNKINCYRGQTDIKEKKSPNLSLKNIQIMENIKLKVKI